MEVRMRWDVRVVFASLLVLTGCADSGTPAAGVFDVLPPGSSRNPITGVMAGAGGSAGNGAAGRPSTGAAGAAGSGTAGVAGTGMAGAGGMMAAGAGAGGGTAGAMTAGAGGMAGEGTAGAAGTPTTPGSMEPTIPMLTADCPEFRDSTITFMGLGGIQVVAGSKPSSPTAPMVFYWHGTGSFAGEFAGSAADVHRGVVSEGGILISFQGTTGGDLLSGTAIFGEGDFELADQLLACAVQNHNVDPRRVFATGCSAGGLFSTAMAAARSSYMAAAAPNSGGLTVPVPFETEWTPALMTVHGAMGRDVVIIDFANSSRTADMAFKNRGGFVINCDHGGGHCGGRGHAGAIWEFFKAHPYGTKPSPWEGGLPSGINPDCEIF
jgi:hypothetical protein